MTTNYNRCAVHDLLSAARFEPDFAGWLAQVLAKAAGQLGSAEALTAGRPGSWEAALVNQLVCGTVGHDGAALPGSIAKLTDQQVREIRDYYGDGIGTSQRELAAEYGVALSTIRAIVNHKTWQFLQ